MLLVLLPVIEKPLQSSVTFATATVRQVEPLIEMDWLSVYVSPAVERLEGQDEMVVFADSGRARRVRKRSSLTDKLGHILPGNVLSTETKIAEESLYR